MLGCLLTLVSWASMAQTGTISGIVVDATSGEEIIGATVFVPEVSGGAATDIYGKYQVRNIKPGTYTLKVSYVSYQSQTIEGVQVEADKTTTININLSEDVQQLEEIVIQAEQINNAETAILSLQKKALTVQDGISIEEIKKLGSSNAAESMKSVTGAAVEDGKYIVMRGLGDRYSITQLNGVMLPSTDPYRNSTSMDLIPADMIDNIITAKTFTADQPGNFTGGSVNIATKSLPEEFYMNFGFSLGFNTQASLIDDFITDGANGGSDWLGYDDGTRALPAVWNDPNNIEVINGFITTSVLARNDAELRSVYDATSRSLDNPFFESEESTFLNNSINFSIGNQYLIGENPFGFNLGINYGKDYSYYDDGRSGVYFDGGNENTLIREQDFVDREGQENTQLGGLLSFAYQFSPNHEIKLDNLYNHDNNTRAYVGEGYWRTPDSERFNTRFISFLERELYSTQLSGKHYFENLNNIKLEWTGSYVVSNLDLPDARLFAFYIEEVGGVDSYILQQSEIGLLPSHFYRELTDNQINGKFDLEIPIAEDRHQIKTGLFYSNKERDFNELIFSQNQVLKEGLNPSYVSFAEAAGNFAAFFDVSNSGFIDSPETNGTSVWGNGNIYRNATNPANAYTGEEIIVAGYAMGVFELSSNFKAIAGARVESTDLSAASADPTETAGSINVTDVLPSLNLIYNLNEFTNLRVAGSRTLARPNMREIAPFASQGELGRPITLGNPDLDRTLITNIDARYEIFPRPGELFAVSAYYKSFEDPIIYILTPRASTAEIQPINSENANVYGIEVEFRKSLDFISEGLANFKISSNFSFIRSRVDKAGEELQALRDEQAQGRRLNLEDWREFQGQSPYILNIALLHSDDNLGWENTISFNIWGDRLAFVTDALTPDVYEQSRPILNFVSKKQVGEHISLGFKATNLLNPKFLKEYDFQSNDIFQSFTRGQTFSISVSYSH